MQEKWATGKFIEEFIEKRKYLKEAYGALFKKELFIKDKDEIN